MNEQEKSKSKAINAWLLGIAVGAVILGALATAYQIGRNDSEGGGTSTGAETTTTEATTTDQESTGATTSAASAAGEDLFASGCGSCHTLAAAGTTGTTGPDLDGLQPDQEQVAAAIADGGAGSGVMPSGIYSGKEAEQVAEYVSSVAGQ